MYYDWDMTKTTEISFTTDTKGNRLAWRYDRIQRRSFRISLDKAKLMIATGQAHIAPTWIAAR